MNTTLKFSTCCEYHTIPSLKPQLTGVSRPDRKAETVSGTHVFIKGVLKQRSVESLTSKQQNANVTMGRALIVAAVILRVRCQEKEEVIRACHSQSGSALSKLSRPPITYDT